MPNAWAGQLETALAQAADAEPDPVKKSKIRAAAEAVGSVGGQVVAGAKAAYLAQVTGWN